MRMSEEKRNKYGEVATQMAANMETVKENNFLGIWFGPDSMPTTAAATRLFGWGGQEVADDEEREANFHYRHKVWRFAQYETQDLYEDSPLVKVAYTAPFIPGSVPTTMQDRVAKYGTAPYWVFACHMWYDEYHDLTVLAKIPAPKEFGDFGDRGYRRWFSAMLDSVGAALNAIDGGQALPAWVIKNREAQQAYLWYLYQKKIAKEE